jgi:hypothetical protein
MSVQSSNKLSLILPVFKGEGLFLGAVQSIERSPIPFGKIIISFNGSSSADYDAFVRRREMGEFQREYVLFRTNEDLTAAEHGQFLLKNLKGFIRQDAIIMFLAHDDRLLTPGSNIQKQLRFIENLDPATVYFPTYSCCQAGDYDNVTHVLARDADYSADEFFWLTMRESVSTNMSGMIVPFFAWVYALTEAGKSQSGARFEHMLCIAPTVKSVHFHGEVNMLIGERPNSDGKQLTMLQHRKAAFSYVLAYWRNGHLRELRRIPPFLYQLARKYLAYAIAGTSLRLRGNS